MADHVTLDLEIQRQTALMVSAYYENVIQPEDLCEKVVRLELEVERLQGLLAIFEDGYTTAQRRLDAILGGSVHLDALREIERGSPEQYGLTAQEHARRYLEMDGNIQRSCPSPPVDRNP